MDALKRDKKGRLVKGTPPGPGRPLGSVSVITKLKQQFADDPKGFDEFVERYKENPNNEKHIAEMIDGKPSQSVDHTSQGEKLEITGIVINTPNEKNDTDTTES